MATTPRLNPTARRLITLYSSTLLAGMWSMIVPALAVLARSFDISLATSTFDVVPASARGRLQAVRRTIAETGGIGAPLFGGYLADTFNPGVPFLAYAPLLVLSAVLLALVAQETLEK